MCAVVCCYNNAQYSSANRYSKQRVTVSKKRKHEEKNDNVVNMTRTIFLSFLSSLSLSLALSKRLSG